jgi:small redox-active disulfide protein 2
MKIKVYGSGCPKCKHLEENTKKALEEKGKKADIEKVTDKGKIIQVGIMMTPALEVDGKVYQQVKSFLLMK